ncbi:MAG TPA: DNA gyrase inhibitor YacG [Candidatus Margulisiibacteriota bacterium]|nr:DNA gyrase inhibitor YacG [Candidatus Margulisiibacteriota bacterium]
MLKDVRCPTCRRLTPWDGNPFRPFCCERCKLRDLGNWASGRYVIPGRPADAAPEEDAADDDDTEPH